MITQRCLDNPVHQLSLVPAGFIFIQLLVDTKEGKKAIETIEAGDYVAAKNLDTGEVEYREVMGTSVNESQILLKLTVAGEVIEATPNHAFYIHEKGWAEAGDVTVGDYVTLQNGTIAQVEKVAYTVLATPIKVYNFAVEGLRNYYVGELEVLVHNTCEGVGYAYGESSEVATLLDRRPELVGSNREKLLSSVQDSDLRMVVSELYRPGATVADGGTAAKLVAEFNNGLSGHLQKAIERLGGLKKVVAKGNLGLNDLDIAEALISDLEYATNLFR